MHLAPETAKRIRETVGSGTYRSADEVTRNALHLLDLREDQNRKETEALKSLGLT